MKSLLLVLSHNGHRLNITHDLQTILYCGCHHAVLFFSLSYKKLLYEVAFAIFAVEDG